MKRLIIAALLLVLIMPIAGCGTLGKLGGVFGGIFTPNRHNDYAEANLRIKAKEVKYTEQWVIVVNPDTKDPREGIMTEAQYHKFEALQDNVISAEGPVYDDIKEWRATNTRPPSYDGREKTLFAAIDEFIAYVKKEAVKP